MKVLVILLLSGLALSLAQSRHGDKTAKEAPAISRSLLAKRPKVSLAAMSITPDLHPESDKAFFGHDYPDDQQPSKLHKFTHPHPVVQESDDYDHDYVKDENSDGGEWKAQFHYDTLRSRIHEAQHIADMRKQQREDAKEAMKEAEKEAAAAAAKADAVRKLAGTTKDELKAMEAEEKALGNKTLTEAERAAAEARDKKRTGESDVDVDGAMKDVDNNMSELEKCKKALLDAQERLKKMMKASSSGQAALEDVKKENAAEVVEAEKDAAQAQSAAQEKADALKERVKKLEEQAKVHEKAKEEWSLTKTELDDLEAKLKKAEENLRKYRHKAVTPGGGIYYTSKDKYDPCAGCPQHQDHAEKDHKKAHPTSAGSSSECSPERAKECSAKTHGADPQASPVGPMAGAGAGDPSAAPLRTVSRTIATLSLAVMTLAMLQ